MRVSLSRIGCAAILCALSAPLAAAAEPAATRLVRRIEPFVRPHPLADAQGRVPITTVLPPGVTAESVGMREVAPGVGAVRLTPLELETWSAAHPDLPLFAGPSVRPQLDEVGKWLGTKDLRAGLPKGEGVGRGAIVGVVDTGVDVTHPAFRAADGTSRILWLLTWGNPRGVHPELEAAYGCTDAAQAACAIYSKEDIDAMLANERPIPDDVHDFAGHGTHVTGIAAGNGGTLAGENDIFVGVAPEANIIVASPSPGGGFGDDVVLRSTRFIFDRAEELGLPAVANLSLGGDFGPHDGTSPLEAGLAAMVGDSKPGRVVVVAAGNSGAVYDLGDDVPGGTHTEVAVSDHAPVRAPILVPGAAKGDVFVFIHYRDGDALSVGLEAPDGTWITPVPPGDDEGYDDGNGTTGAVVNDEPGKSGITDDGAVVVWSGEWEKDGEFAVLLEGSGVAEMWITASGEAAQNGAYFRAGLREGTINTPASHPRLLAVGCTLNRLQWSPVPLPGQKSAAVGLPAFGPDDDPLEDSLCYFSAGGPTPLGVSKPEIVAPGAFVASAMSMDADPRLQSGGMFDGPGCPEESKCYVVGDRYALGVGTSMSAPVVAGAVAVLLDRQPSLTQAQATEILQASARHPAGKVSPRSLMGAGALDLRHALEVLATTEVAGPPPDVAQSFWVMSASTARPDPSWQVPGTVQLRRADGSIASGLDGSLLRVEVENGTLARGLVKARHGMFTFAVSAPAGSGGTRMKVRVFYDGQPIGETAILSIGVDALAAASDFTVDGGCNCTTVSSSSGGRGALLALSLVAASWVRRRRSLRRSRASGASRA